VGDVRRIYSHGRWLEVETLDTGVPDKAIKAKREERHVGFPWAFFVDACRLTDGHNDLAVALYIYRRTKVCNSLTVTLPGHELAELGVNRKRKRETLIRLKAVGLIRFKTTVGQSTKVTLLWPK
jgi:hypothetical protein